MMPSYIAGDAFRLFPKEISPDGNWPSLLVGPKGSRSALHVDADSTHFYLLLLQVWKPEPATRSLTARLTGRLARAASAGGSMPQNIAPRCTITYLRYKS